MAIGAYSLGSIPREGDGLNQLPMRVIKDGCDLHPVCTTCPLPKCKYDSSGAQRGERQREIARTRSKQVMVMVSQGALLGEIAEEIGVSRATVGRFYLKPAGLSPRVLEIRARRTGVKEQFLDGLSDAQIASALGISMSRVVSDRTVMGYLRKRDRRRPQAIVLSVRR